MQLTVWINLTISSDLVRGSIIIPESAYLCVVTFTWLAVHIDVLIRDFVRRHYALVEITSGVRMAIDIYIGVQGLGIVAG